MFYFGSTFFGQYSPQLATAPEPVTQRGANIPTRNKKKIEDEDFETLLILTNSFLLYQRNGQI